MEQPLDRFFAISGINLNPIFSIGERQMDRSSRALSPNYKWIVLSITTIGVFMVSLDMAVVVLALPDIMTDLHSSLVSATWVLMIYTFIGTVFLLALGRVGDIFGRIRLYNIGFLIFTLRSGLCGFSTLLAAHRFPRHQGEEVR